MPEDFKGRVYLAYFYNIIYATLSMSHHKNETKITKQPLIRQKPQLDGVQRFPGFRKVTRP